MTRAVLLASAPPPSRLALVRHDQCVQSPRRRQTVAWTVAPQGASVIALAT